MLALAVSLRRIAAAALLMLLPGLLVGQKRTKAPLYADDALVISNNLIQLRVPALFYINAFANEQYKSTALPILLGVRYERHFKNRTSFGAELEYNSWAPQEKGKIKDQHKPDQEKTIKFTPFVRFYLRSNGNRKKVFQGVNIIAGPTVLSIAQSLDPNSLSRSDYKYSQETILAFSISPGVQFNVGPHVTFGANYEAIFSGEQFHQEGYYKTDIGNGAGYLNVFKFYIGSRF